MKKLSGFAVSILLILSAAAAISQAPASAGAGGDSPCGPMTNITVLAEFNSHDGATIFDPAVKFISASKHIAIWHGDVPPLTAVMVGVFYHWHHSWQYSLVQVDPSLGRFHTRGLISEVVVCGYATVPAG